MPTLISGPLKEPLVIVGTTVVDLSKIVSRSCISPSRGGERRVMRLHLPEERRLICLDNIYYGSRRGMVLCRKLLYSYYRGLLCICGTAVPETIEPLRITSDDALRNFMSLQRLEQPHVVRIDTIQWSTRRNNHACMT